MQRRAETIRGRQERAGTGRGPQERGERVGAGSQDQAGAGGDR